MSKIQFHISLLSVLCLCLFACQNKQTENHFGNLDPNLIAADTTMQVNMDRSYEYQRSLPESDTVVFDFLAYDKPVTTNSPNWESKFIVIRRTNTEHDTVIKAKRSDKVEQVWLCDLNQDGIKELMFYEIKPGPQKSARLYAYELNGKDKGYEISFEPKNESKEHRGLDTFYTSQNLLIRKFPYFNTSIDSIPSGHVTQKYKLTGRKLSLENSHKE